jgi:DinB family protein
VTDEQADRRQAIEEVRADRVRTQGFLEAIDPNAFETVGLGGSDWSLKDLVGHLETWEQHALDAIAAWERGAQPPIGDALRAFGTDEVNRRAVAKKADRSADEVRATAAATHAQLLDALERATDDWWAAPAVDGEAPTHGQRLGGILGGDLGLFRHDPDHWDDLTSFAKEHPAS